MATNSNFSNASVHFLNDEMLRRRNPAQREEQQLKRMMIISWCGFTCALLSMLCVGQ